MPPTSGPETARLAEAAGVEGAIAFEPATDPPREVHGGLGFIDYGDIRLETPADGTYYVAVQSVDPEATGKYVFAPGVREEFGLDAVDGMIDLIGFFEAPWPPAVGLAQLEGGDAVDAALGEVGARSQVHARGAEDLVHAVAPCEAHGPGVDLGHVEEDGLVGQVRRQRGVERLGHVGVVGEERADLAAAATAPDDAVAVHGLTIDRGQGRRVRLLEPGPQEAPRAGSGSSDGRTPARRSKGTSCAGTSPGARTAAAPMPS